MCVYDSRIWWSCIKIKHCFQLQALSSSHPFPVVFAWFCYFGRAAAAEDPTIVACSCIVHNTYILVVHLRVCRNRRKSNAPGMLVHNTRKHTQWIPVRVESKPDSAVRNVRALIEPKFNWISPGTQTPWVAIDQVILVECNLCVPLFTALATVLCHLADSVLCVCVSLSIDFIVWSAFLRCIL